MPLQQTFHCPPLTYTSTLNNQRRINTPLVTQCHWEPQEAHSAQYASYGIISLITRLDHSNPSMHTDPTYDQWETLLLLPPSWLSTVPALHEHVVG